MKFTKVLSYVSLFLLAQRMKLATAFKKFPFVKSSDISGDMTEFSLPKLGGMRHSDPRERYECSFPKGLYQLGTSARLFVSPGIPLLVTPIWFWYDDDSSQWYWTPFTKWDVQNVSELWIPVTQERVPATIKVSNLLARTFLGEKPVEANIKIIRYLNQEAPDPSNLSPVN